MNTSDAALAMRLPRLHRFRTLFGWGLRRSVRTKRFNATTMLALVVGGGLGWVAGRQGDSVQALWYIVGEHLLGMAVPLVALALVGSGFGEEVQDRTLVYHLVRPVSRRTVFLARYVAGLVPATCVGAALVLLALFASRVDFPPRVFLAVGVVAAVGTASTGALYYALAAVFRRGLIAGLVYTFVVEGFLQFLPGTTQKLALTHHVRSLFHRLTDDDFAARSQAVARSLDSVVDERDPLDLLRAAARVEWTSVPSALVVCAGVAVVALWIGARAVARRDFALKD
jgi:hypothetical protein